MKELSLLFEGLRGYATRDFPSGFLEGSLYKSPLFHGSDYDLREGETLQPQFGSEWGIYLSPNARYAKNMENICMRFMLIFLIHILLKIKVK